MTVGELKEVLKLLPEEMEVQTGVSTPGEYNHGVDYAAVFYLEDGEEIEPYLFLGEGDKKGGES